MSRKQIFSLVALLLVTGCAWFKPADHFGTREISYNELTGWQDDDHTAALSAFLESCPVFARKARPATAGSDIRISESVWQSLCDDGKAALLTGDAKGFFERRFTPFRVNNNGREEGLFTGYYEPVLYGSHHKGGDFIYPLYMAPPELKNQKPFLTHAAINEGALEGKHLELVWVDDPVMLFFLQIQGSGRIKFNNGRELQVGYADQNGQGYVGLGKLMGDEGVLPKDEINFFTIRSWLYQHRDEAFPMMQRNPSYVFFKPMETLGAVGAAGVKLAPARSLAVDNRYIPYGLPLYLDTMRPGPAAGDPYQPFRRLMIAQDTGGAIKGPVRGDVFFGSGDEAEYLAGYMKGRGTYTLLVPKEVRPPK